MNAKQDELNSEFFIKFDGQLHQVDANTLINSLINVSTIIQEVNEELKTDKKIEIKIKALAPGSFTVHLKLFIEAAKDLLSESFARGDISSASDIIAILAGLLAIKKFLKSKKPEAVEENGNKIIIYNDKGKTIIVDKIVYNIYKQNQPVQDAISNNFETLQRDPSIEKYEIADINRKPLFSAGRPDFDGMAVKSEVLEENKKVITEIATLTIFKIVFEEKYKWEFYYKGNKISASIVDEDFFQQIDAGKKFSKGDRLIAELQVTQLFDPTVQTWVNHSYQLNKVKEHIPRGEQQKLDLE